MSSSPLEPHPGPNCSWALNIEFWRHRYHQCVCPSLHLCLDVFDDVQVQDIPLLLCYCTFCTSTHRHCFEMYVVSAPCFNGPVKCLLPVIESYFLYSRHILLHWTIENCIMHTHHPVIQLSIHPSIPWSTVDWEYCNCVFLLLVLFLYTTSFHRWPAGSFPLSLTKAINWWSSTGHTCNVTLLLLFHPSRSMLHLSLQHQ